MLEKTNNVKGFDNIVMQLYKKFDLIASKIIVIKIEKHTRNFDDWLVAELPQPTFIIEHTKGYFLGWSIVGKIDTKQQKKFYKNLALRIKKTLLKRTDLDNVKVSSVWALQYALENGYKEANKKIYEMKYLAKNCESLSATEEKNNKLNKEKNLDEELSIFAGTYTKSDDALFDFIRFKAYDYARINSVNNIKNNLEDLDNYCKIIAEIGVDVLGAKKGIGSAYSKAKNIAKWVYKNYQNGKRKRKTKNYKELLMTRQERSKKNAQLKYDRAHKKILNMITGLYANEYKKKDGTWNILKLARDLKMSKNTIKRHLKDSNLI